MTADPKNTSNIIEIPVVEPADAPPATAIAIVEPTAPIVVTPLEQAREERRRQLAAASAHVLHSYLGAYTSKKSQKTLAESLKRIAVGLLGPQATAEQVPWAALTRVEIDAARRYLIENRKPATVRISLVALRGVLQEAWQQELITKEELARLTSWQKVKASRLPAGRDLAAVETDAIGDYVDGVKGLRGACFRCVFGILFGAGLRATEFCKLEVSAYSERRLRFIRKGDKEADVPVGDAAAIVDEWMNVRRHLVRTGKIDPHLPWLAVHIGRHDEVRGPWTVKRLEHFCAAVAKHLGLKHFTPHDCRRTFATRMLASGVDLATVQRLMSHESPETTAKYDRRQAVADAAARESVTLLWKRR